MSRSRKIKLNITKKIPNLTPFFSRAIWKTPWILTATSVVNAVPTVVETVGKLYSEFEQKYEFRHVHSKMDTQGFDLDVFAGAENVQGRLTSIQSGVALKHIYQWAPVWTDALAVYERAGFEVADLFAVNPHRAFLSEMDFFIKWPAANL